MAIGWVPPLIFVLICATLEKTRALHIGYGAGTVCFIENQRAGLCLLGVPVAISVVFNAVFFLKTLLIIRRTREQTRRRGQPVAKSHEFQAVCPAGGSHGLHLGVRVSGLPVLALLAVPLCRSQHTAGSVHSGGVPFEIKSQGIVRPTLPFSNRTSARYRARSAS